MTSATLTIGMRSICSRRSHNPLCAGIQGAHILDIYIEIGVKDGKSARTSCPRPLSSSPRQSAGRAGGLALDRLVGDCPKRDTPAIILSCQRILLNKTYSVADSNMAAGSVKTQASAMFLSVDICRRSCSQPWCRQPLTIERGWSTPATHNSPAKPPALPERIEAVLQLQE